jgi:hypothetical protein
MVIRIEQSQWIWIQKDLKGQCQRDFLLLVFFMNQFPPSPRVSY